MPTLSFVRQDSDTSGSATSKASGSFTPVAGDGLLLAAQVRGQIANPTISDSQSLGWTQIGKALYNGSADASYLYAANGPAAASAMTATLNQGAACAEILLAIYKVASATRFGSSAVRGFNPKQNDSGANNPSAALPVAALTSNAVLVQVGNNASGGITGPAGWTQGLVFEFQAAGSADGYFVNSGFTGTTPTWADHIGNGTNSYDWIAELDFSSAVAVLPRLPRVV
jgi:hypothetical protein